MRKHYRVKIMALREIMGWWTGDKATVRFAVYGAWSSKVSDEPGRRGNQDTAGELPTLWNAGICE